MDQEDSLSHAAWLRSLIIIFILTGILIVFANHLISSQEITTRAKVIKKIDLKHIDEMLIGSETPRLIYADRSKVIFDANGVFVYDLEKQKVAQTFDTAALHQGEQCSSMATKDGKLLIFNYSDHYVFTKAYQYSFEDDSFLELSRDSWDTYCDQAYECEVLPSNDIRFKSASGGYIAKFSKDEYVYLTFSNWKVDTLQIVYVHGENHTIYKVFEPNT